MHLKKTLYTLVSTLTLSALLCGIAKAIPMQVVFDEVMQKMKPEKQVSDHIQKLKSYLEEKAPRTKSTLTGLDPVSVIRRKDSIAFGLFCCMCYKNNWTNYVRYAAERRDANDRKEDIEVLKDIFPNSVNGPDGLLALYDRLGINPDDVTIDSYDRDQLIAFIHVTPLFELGEENEIDRLECEKRKRFKDRKGLLEVDVVDDSMDTTIETVLSPRSQRREKAKMIASGLSESEKHSRSRKRRNKPNCLSAVRDDSKRDGWLGDDR